MTARTQRHKMAEAEDCSAACSDIDDDDDEWEYAGLEAIDRACREVYPDQLNPLQATAVVKYWNGGPDPLDYISIYSNHGDSDKDIPPHWHYISHGFSDLYGDSRVHQYRGSSDVSGYGFEMTFRLKKLDSETSAPMWPSGLMNRLASYVFQTGNVFHVGDHIPWHKSLDVCTDTPIQHMLVAQDPQLSDINSPYGQLKFIQLVGVTDDEMKAAQRWKGVGVLNLMKSVQSVGPYYITDLSRSSSIFDEDSSLMTKVTDGISVDGSNLGHVTAVCLWTDIHSRMFRDTDSMKNETTVNIDGVHLMFDLEAADLLPMVIRGRLQKGRFFVFHNAENQVIHLIPPDLQDDDVFVNEIEPMKARGTYLQIFCSHSLLEKMYEEFERLHDTPKESQSFPREFRFSDPTIKISVVEKGRLFEQTSLTDM